MPWPPEFIPALVACRMGLLNETESVTTYPIGLSVRVVGANRLPLCTCMSPRQENRFRPPEEYGNDKASLALPARSGSSEIDIDPRRSCGAGLSELTLGLEREGLLSELTVDLAVPTGRASPGGHASSPQRSSSTSRRTSSTGNPAPIKACNLPNAASRVMPPPDSTPTPRKRLPAS